MDERLTNFAQQAAKAGKDIYERIMKRRNASAQDEDEILPYNGSDGFYSDSEAAETAETDQEIIFDNPEPISENEDAYQVQMNDQAPPEPEDAAADQDDSEEMLDEEIQKEFEKFSPKTWKQMIHAIADKLSPGSGNGDPEPQILFDEDAQLSDECDEQEIEEDMEDVQDAFLYYQGLSEKIENLKQNIADRFKRDQDENVSEKLDAVSQQISETQAQQLERLTMVLDDHAALLKQLFGENTRELQDTASQVRQAVDAFDASAKNRLDSITDSLNSLYDMVRSSDQSIEKICSDAAALTQKVDEINQTLSAVSKLADSVFELKVANASMKLSITELSDSQAKLEKKCTAGFILLGIISLACLALQICQLVM